MSRPRNRLDFVTQDTGVDKRVCAATPEARSSHRLGRCYSRLACWATGQPCWCFAAIAMAIPLSLLFATFALDTRSKRRAGDKRIPFESGVSAERVPRPPLHDLLLPDRDAVHRVRHRDRVPVSAGGAACTRWARSDSPRWPCSSLLLAVAYVYVWREGRAGMAVTPVSISKAVRAGDLEQYVMLTTLEKAMAWTSSNSIWPAGFGLACCAIEMMSLPSPALRHRPLRLRGVPLARRARPT